MKTFLLSLLLVTVTSMAFGAASTETALKNNDVNSGYECIFSKPGGLIPDKDNPYQEIPKQLSQAFCSREWGKPLYSFPSAPGNVLVLGTYKIDKGKRLGYGDEGTVYLAYDTKSGIFVAAKSIGGLWNEELKGNTCRSLKELGQLYSVWRRRDKEIPSASDVWAIMPFVDGRDVNYYRSSSPWIKTSLEAGRTLKISNLFSGVRLVRSLLQQLHYIASKGVFHDSASASNAMVSHDYRNVVLIDFNVHYTEKSPFVPSSPSEFLISPYSFYIHYFLGTRDFLNEINKGLVKSPESIIKFIETIWGGLKDKREDKEFSLAKIQGAFDAFLEEAADEVTSPFSPIFTNTGFSSMVDKKREKVKISFLIDDYVG